jgi:hypothetical protein
VTCKHHLIGSLQFKSVLVEGVISNFIRKGCKISRECICCLTAVTRQAYLLADKSIEKDRQKLYDGQKEDEEI